MIRIQPSACILMAALILLLPLDWLIAAILAAAVHELGHLAVIRAIGGHPTCISIGVGGTKILTEPMENRWEFFCAAAGPAASLLLLSVCRLFPKLALCGLIQGIFNLILVYPMDGGRMLRCLLCRFCPRRAERIVQMVQRLILCGVLTLALVFAVRRKGGFFPVLVCMTALTRMLLSKIPCKSG